MLSMIVLCVPIIGNNNANNILHLDGESDSYQLSVSRMFPAIYTVFSRIFNVLECSSDKDTHSHINYSSAI